MRNLPTVRDDAPNLIFWLPTFAGVLVLIAALIFTVTRLYDSPEKAADQLPQPIAPFEPLTPASFLPQSSQPPSVPASPSDARPGGIGGSSTAAKETGYSPTTRPSPTPSRTVRPAPTPTAAPVVRGTYHVLNTYGTYNGTFIGEVLVSNSSGQDRNWTVTLRFPSNVGRLVTSWVEGAPQATLTTSGATYTWRSGVPVPAGSSVPLRFQFERSSPGDYPSTCTANGTACTIR